MTPFKRFFTEALSLSDVRKHKLSRKTSGAYSNDRLKEVFGDEDRLIYNIDIDRLAMVDHPLMNEIIEFFESLEQYPKSRSYWIPDIDNAKKYIVAVHIYFPTFKEKEARSKAMAIDEINKIAQSGVNYYIYDDVAQFGGLMTSKAHKLDSAEHQYELWELPRKYSFQDKQDKELHDEIDWVINPTKENINRDYLYYDFISSFNTDIHNAKRDMRPAAQSALHKLSEYIRKTRKSIKQLVDDAQEKSRKILEY